MTALRLAALLAVSLVPACAGAQSQLAVSAAEAQLVLPSGQSAQFVDAIPEGEITRFRFLAPQIAGAVSSEAALTDIDWICANFALPRAGKAEQLVVSLMDRVVPFGETDPAATQYFEVFNVSGGTCEIEVFEDE